MKHEAAHEKVENAPFSIFYWRVIGILSYWQSLFCTIRQEDPQKSSCPCYFADRLPLAPNFSRLSQIEILFSVSFHLPVHCFISEVIVTKGRVATMLKRGRRSSHPSVLFHYAILRITKKAILSSAVVLPNKKNCRFSTDQEHSSRREWQAFEGTQAGVPNDGFLPYTLETLLGYPTKYV